MNRLHLALFACVLICGGTAGSAAVGQAAPPQELRSQASKGLVVLVPEPALSDGRLILRVVAFNQTGEPATLRAADVTLTTASGAAVRITPLAELVQQARKDAGAAGEDLTTFGAGIGGPPAVTSEPITGQANISNFTGGSGLAANAVVSAASRRGAKPLSVAAQKALDDQVAALKAGILDVVEVAPKGAAGGQVVTEKLKFKSADKRGLKAVVTFAGEVHQFQFVAPLIRAAGPARF